MRENEPGPTTKRYACILGAAIILLASLLGGCSINPRTLSVTALRLIPDQQQYIFMNEISYDKALDRVIVPGGGTGKLFLIDPGTKSVESIDVASPGGSGGGVVSAAGGLVVSRADNQEVPRNYLFVADRSGPTPKLHVFDPESSSKEPLVSQDLQGKPEYVRFIYNTKTSANEIWVTEPEQEQIEIFIFEDGNGPSLEPLIITDPDTQVPISVPGGPTGLIYDADNALVYTNQPKLGQTKGYQVISHAPVKGRAWGNGCTNARGLALSEDGQYLFIACEEGKLVVIDVKSGVQVMNAIFGKDLNQVSYFSETGCIYLPSGWSEIMGVFRMAAPTPVPTPTRSPLDKILPARATATPFAAISRLQPGGPTATPENPAAASPENRVLALFSSADTAPNADCVATDKNGNVWVCDPQNGRVLFVVGVDGCINQEH